jgi:hypothetical protein
MISLTLCNILACFEFLSIELHESSVRLCTGIEKMECAIQPGRRRDIMPKDAMQKVIYLLA